MSVFELFPSPVQKTDGLFAQVVERVAVAIVSGLYKSGDIIPTLEDLNAEMSVSRTAYREAIKYLSSKGLIEARPKVGTRVAPRATWNLLDPEILRWSLSGQASGQFVRDLFELRRVIEPSAARLAALRRTPEQLAAIQRALDGMTTLGAYTEGNFRADLAFHEAILDATNNSALSCLKSVVRTTVLWSLRLNTGRKTAADFVKPLADHTRVYEAIAARDGEQAAAFMTVVVVDAVEETLENIATQRDPKAARTERATLKPAPVVPLPIGRPKTTKK
ncbi:MAG: FadR/GntR family transcriptional regulator [Hyphomicrobiaceae bacterium]|nr:FadR family transcriptional regulator [Hyphomicrobiaceae bacterium]